MDRAASSSARASPPRSRRPAFAQEAYPDARRSPSSIAFPPGGVNDVVDAAARRGARADPQAAGRDRDQGRRRRRGRRAGRRRRQARRLHAAVAHHLASPAYAEVDKLFGRTPKIHPRRLHPDRAAVADPIVLVVNDQQPYKTLKDLVDDAKKRPDADHLQFLRALRRDRTCRWRCSRRRPADCSCGICRPTAAARPSPPSSATTRSASCRRPSIALPHIKAGKLRALARSARAALEGAARRADLQGSSATTSNIISGSACSRPRARRPTIVTYAARQPSTRPRTADQFKTAHRQSRPGSRLSRPAGIREILGRGRQAHADDAVQWHRPRAGMSRKRMTLRADHVAGAAFVAFGIADHRAERRSADRTACRCPAPASCRRSSPC